MTTIKSTGSKATQKQLEAAKAESAKLHGILNKYQTKCGELDTEIRQLESDHRAAATAAAINGDPAVKLPKRLTNARDELETALQVRDDLREKYAASEADVIEAEENHTAARVAEVAGVLEVKAQKLFAIIGEAYVELIEVAGVDGWSAIKAMIDRTVLYEDKHPVDLALRAEGLNPHAVESFRLVPEGAFIQDYSDRATELHNQEQVKREMDHRV